MCSIVFTTELGLGAFRGRDLDGDALVHVAHDFGDRLVRSRRNDLRGGGDDGAGRAIVARKPHGPGRRVILSKAVEAGRIGATKAVDRLVGVADRAQVAVGRRQQGQQPVLLLVDILEFVDRDPPQAARGRARRCAASDIRTRTDKRDEIVEVDPVAQRHRAGIGRPRLRRPRRPPSSACASPWRCARSSRSALCALSSSVAASSAMRSASPATRKPRPRPAARRMLAQDGEAERMEGMDGDLVRAVGEQACKALAHLAGGAAGEGDGEAALRRRRRARRPDGRCDR